MRSGLTMALQPTPTCAFRSPECVTLVMQVGAAERRSLAHMSDDLDVMFTPRGIMRGGTLLLQPAEAIELIETARARDRRVLGVESFTVTDNATVPLGEHILDLSNARGTFDSWAAARRFVEERAHLGFVFEVVV
jgi:hypothetical protein